MKLMVTLNAPIDWETSELRGPKVKIETLLYVLQSTQFFVLPPTPSTLGTHHTSCTNHTDPSEYIPTNSTTIGTSQSTHTHATHFL